MPKIVFSIEHHIKLLHDKLIEWFLESNYKSDFCQKSFQKIWRCLALLGWQKKIPWIFCWNPNTATNIWFIVVHFFLCFNISTFIFSINPESAIHLERYLPKFYYGNQKLKNYLKTSSSKNYSKNMSKNCIRDNFTYSPGIPPGIFLDFFFVESKKLLLLLLQGSFPEIVSWSASNFSYEPAMPQDYFVDCYRSSRKELIGKFWGIAPSFCLKWHLREFFRMIFLRFFSCIPSRTPSGSTP